MSCINFALSDLEDIFKGENKKQLNDILQNKDLILNIENAIYSANKFYLNANNDIYDVDSNYRKKFNKILFRYSVKKVYIIYMYQKMISENKLQFDINFIKLLQKKPIRNLSGVNAFAILLPPYPNGQPFSCKHDCHYCPNEIIKNGALNDMPRSYLSDEPAVARGLRNNWDACKQLTSRLNSLVIQGHTLGKLDLILEGGTYTEYPMDFLNTFHRDLFYCANTYFQSLPKREAYTLEEEIKINMYSKIQIIGVCIETRPDVINNEWIKFFRHVGITRIQLGVQHTNNKILKRVNRGHTFEDSCKAVDMLKNNCFKIDIHLMPDLPFSTPDDDIKMFDIVFKTDLIQPDQVKIYPCQITPYTKIKKWYDKGIYTPYFETDYDMFLNVIQYSMTIVPPWVRLPRVVRDIPSSSIEGGNTHTDLRQVIERKIKSDGDYSMDIRYREIGRHHDYKNVIPVIKTHKYRSGSGLEYFISYASKDDKVIFGFVRLRIPDLKTHIPVFKTLINKGLIRELHIYNNIVAVGDKNKINSTQHKGMGIKLIKTAEYISWLHGLHGVAVITGEGVRSYYHKKLNYHDEDTFVIKNFYINLYQVKMIILIIITFLLILFNLL